MNLRISFLFNVFSWALIGSILLAMPWYNLAADYSNPVIKVLLLESKQGIKLNSTTVLKSDKVRFAKNAGYQILIKPRLTEKSFDINGHRLTTERITFAGHNTIQVEKINSSFKRRYEGTIELLLSKKGFYVINHIPIESYLKGVLNAEISTDWPIEVVKAQTIISRTFALYKREKQLNRAWHVTSGQSDQVYKGINISDKRGTYAIQATQGIVVSYEGKLALTFYHSNCGGITEDPVSLWNASFPYLKSRSVPFGRSDPRYNWQMTLSDKEMTTILRRSGLTINRIFDMSVVQWSPSGRAYQLEFNRSSKLRLKAKIFRQKAGYKRIQSLLFDVVRVPGGFHFKGKGNGHGVGLSQWSAKEMAEKGYTHSQILNFFYKGTALTRYQG